jgi:hypothetical protein
MLALRMIPSDVIAKSREEAREVMDAGKPTSWTAAVVIVAFWLFLAAMVIAVAVRILCG